MKIYGYLIILLLVANNSFCQTPSLELLWANGTGNLDHDNASILETDMLGNIYIGGTFSREVDFDFGPSVNSLSTVYSNYYGRYITSNYLAKYNEDGEFIWVVSFDEAEKVRFDDMKISNSGNIVLTGRFAGDVDFDPGPGEHIEYAGSNNGNRNFVLQLNLDGEFQWVKKQKRLAQNWGINSARAIDALEIDDNNSIYIASGFVGTVEVQTVPELIQIASENSQDVFVLKYSEQGNLLWSKVYGGLGSQSISDIEFDNEDNLMISGVYSYVINFELQSTDHVYSNNNYFNGYVVKFDSSGNFLWSTSFLEMSSIEGIALDEANNIYITGEFDDELNNIISNGSSDIYVLKINKFGNLQWMRTFGGWSSENCTEILLNSVGNVFVSGSFNSSVDFDPSSSVFELNSDISHGFISVFNRNGDFIDAIQVGDWIHDINLQSGSNLITSGSYYTEAHFPGVVDSVHLIPNGSNDLFFAKLLAEDGLSIQSDLGNETKFSLFPNPASSKVSIKNNDSRIIEKIELLNSSGKIMITHHNYDNIDLSGVEAALYFVRFTFLDGTVELKKLIVRK